MWVQGNYNPIFVKSAGNLCQDRGDMRKEIKWKGEGEMLRSGKVGGEWNFYDEDEALGMKEWGWRKIDKPGGFED